MCFTLYIFARLSINKFFIKNSFYVVFSMFCFVTFQNGYAMLQVNCTFRTNKSRISITYM